MIERKRYRNCVDWFRAVTAPKSPRPGDSEEWSEIRRKDREGYAHELISESFVTFPVARGDLIVLIRICRACIAAFQYKNGVNADECVVEEPYSDGFGSLPTWSGPEPLATKPDCDADADDETDDGGDDFNDTAP
ncbi:MAG: hypothetical protein ACRDUX_02685 [Mycobacterium sp.]